MKHKLKDPGSAITHLIGMILAAIVSIPLIIKSFLSGDYVRIISLIIFTISMVFMVQVLLITLLIFHQRSIRS